MGEHGMSPYAFVYVETDIPPGMTIAEWRRELTRERVERRQAMREKRRALIGLALGWMSAALRRGPARRQLPA